MARAFLAQSRRGAVALALLIGFLAAAGCQSSEAPAESTAPARAEAEETRDPGPRICTLEQTGQTFLCDMEVSAGPEQSCEAALNPRVYENFLERMTRVSLEMLYLDGEPGAEAPYTWNDPQRIIQDTRLQGCRRAGEQCLCRLSYQDMQLLQVFYDSAGCRRSSRLSRHPLYFRGAGCRY